MPRVTRRQMHIPNIVIGPSARAQGVGKDASHYSVREDAVYLSLGEDRDIPLFCRRLQQQLSRET